MSRRTSRAGLSSRSPTKTVWRRCPAPCLPKRLSQGLIVSLEARDPLCQGLRTRPNAASIAALNPRNGQSLDMTPLVKGCSARSAQSRRSVVELARVHVVSARFFWPDQVFRSSLRLFCAPAPGRRAVIASRVPPPIRRTGVARGDGIGPA